MTQGSTNQSQTGGAHDERDAKSEQTLALDLRAWPCGALLVDHAERVVAANARAARIFRLKRAALRGRAVAELIPHCPAAAVPEQRHHTECVVQRADGSLRTLRVSRIPVIGQGQSLTLVSITDITSRKQRERADADRIRLLAEERDRLTDLVERVPCALYSFRVEPDGTRGPFWFPNVIPLGMHDMTTADVSEGQGSLWERVHPDDIAWLMESTEASTRSGTPWWGQWRVLHPQRGTIWLEGRSLPTRMPDGTTVWHGFMMDVTEHKRAEEAHRNLQRLESLGTLAGGIAHDFNNILLAITGNARLALADVAADSAVRPSLLEIDKASARGADLVRRILAFGRQNETRREPMQVRAVVEEALRLLRASVPAMIDIRVSFADELPFINADSTQMHQIVMNLVTNSVHAIGDDVGVVTVSVDALNVNEQAGSLQPGTYVRLSVGDSGAGMNEATRARIFDPFFTTKPAGQGSGLGLSVVHGIVRSHDGAITVDSTPGEGATFRLYFPAARRQVAAAPNTAIEPARGRGESILYVDDEEALVLLVTRMLQRLGYRVIGFTDPEDALQAFRAHPENFDAVVTDLAMPRMSGFHLARALREVRPDIPVLMTSGYVRPQDREAALALGVCDLIMKPNAAEELGTALARLLGSTLQS